MQTEVQALQQQATATQQSLKALQSRESASPYNTIVSDMQGSLPGVNSTMLGVGSALALATVVVWWYVWRRPLTRWIDAPKAATPREPPVSTRAPLPEHGLTLHSPGSTQPPALAPQDDAWDWDSDVASGDTTQPYASGHSPFARQEPDREFDPEAAASEVTRVRKSLAQKREARALQQDRNDSAYAELDLDLDVGLWQPPREESPQQEPPPVDELISFSLVEENVLNPVEPAPAPMPTPMPDMEPDRGPAPTPQHSGSKGYDFTITLALAHESAALELWNEARDLASEVLESEDPRLVSDALSLLERLNQMELAAPVDTPPWNGVR